VRARSATLRSLLDAQIAKHDAVRSVRLQGLMGGVELAPPAEGLRWGRRVCAAATARGVLLRPLGDVVVLMPPLTITDAELERIVSVLREALDEVCSA
jgi:adenosylmethionine-8-amino-7-oxononanoate aminotransferase